jgi:3-hydroxyisobutyrate dehydrogenase
MAFEYTSIGWIGLGLMGVPMVENLLAKTPESCQYYLFDVMTKPVEELAAKYPNRVHKCQSSKEVADKSVCMANVEGVNKGMDKLTKGRKLFSPWSQRDRMYKRCT